jgi:hypothetical protein
VFLNATYQIFICRVGLQHKSFLKFLTPIWTTRACTDLNLILQRDRILLRKLRAAHLLTKYPTFYRTLRFIAVLKMAPTGPYFDTVASSAHPISLRSILILSFHLSLHLTSVMFRKLLNIVRVACPTVLIILDLITVANFCAQEV